MVSAAKGLYLVIPPEYRTWGGLPGDWFIDELMRYMGRQYYVGLLSAAAVHGASTQTPQTFEVIVDKRVRPRAVGRLMLRYFASRAMATVTTSRHTGGTMGLDGLARSKWLEFRPCREEIFAPVRSAESGLALLVPCASVPPDTR